MEKFKQRLIIMVVVLWVIFPDFIPGPIDDILMVLWALDAND